MILTVRQSSIRGSIQIPASKSHTIRGVIMGTLAHGVSILINPLDAADTRSAVRCCEKLGATIRQDGNQWDKNQRVFARTGAREADQHNSELFHAF